MTEIYQPNPDVINQWLTERINFCGEVLKSQRLVEINEQNQELISEFTAAIGDYKYCKSLYGIVFNEYHKKTITGITSLSDFKRLANKLIMQTNYIIDKQEYITISISGIDVLSRKRSALPQSVRDGLIAHRKQMEEIYNAVNSL